MRPPEGVVCGPHFFSAIGGFQVQEGQEAVDSTADEVTATGDAPMPPEAAEAIEEFIPGPAELAVVDPQDGHEVMLRMDEHDVRMLLERVQSSALRKWVYVLPDGSKGLTVHAVQDIVQTMNWMGRCRIGVLPETLTVERLMEDAGNGPEPFWSVTIFAQDEMTGARQSGASMEPMRMRLKPSTAEAKRKRGMKIPEDNAIFDVFSQTKAINKAERNAQAKFIPEQIEQTVIAMFEKDPTRVEMIKTEAQQAVEELPPPLDDEKARALLARSREVQDEIAAIGPQALVECPPGLVGSYRLRSQHSHDMLRDFIAWLERRRDELQEKFGGGS
jgi:hypothetical protein